MKILIRIINIGLLLFLLGCAPVGVFKQGFDIQSIDKIGILSFIPYTHAFPSSGEIVADEFSRQLLFKGFTVVERRRIDALLQELDLLNDIFSDPEKLKEIGKKLGVEYLLTGTVSRYTPQKRYLVISGKDDLLALEGTGIRTLDIENNDTSIVLADAEVAINARLLEVKTGNIVWIGTYSYESFEIETAIEWTVSGLLKTFKKN